MEAWFNERFLSVMARDHTLARVRLGVGLALGLILAIAADWMPALAWMAGTLALEGPLWWVTRPLAQEGEIDSTRAVAGLLLQTLVVTAWSFAGVVLWIGGGMLGQAAAMSFFAALLFYVSGHRGGARALLVTGTPAFVTPLATLALFPVGGLFERAAVLALCAVSVAQAAFAAARATAPGRQARSSPRFAPPSIGDEELTYESLARAKAEAEAANQAKSAFLAIMSHEIRTPLNGVLGMTQALSVDPTLTPSQRARLTVILNSGESLLSILNDVLDLSKVEAGKLEIESMPFDLAEVASSAHQSFTALAAQKRLKCRLAVEPAAAGTYLGDPTRVRQILYNLISNALKFTAQGEIRISIESADGGVRIVVADTGVGIEQEQLERLFEKFEQADASFTRRYGGTGLGLAICRELCQLMDGEIEVESEPGRGSTFSVTLPLRRIADAPAVARNPAPTPASDLPDASDLRVLAAEDDKTNQQVLKALLGPIGVDPVVVDDGAQAVEAWATGDFDLILMDIQMPTLDGMSATRAIRAEEAKLGRPPVTIIALTANTMAHQIDEYLSAGMDGHVAKPVQFANLCAAIRDAQARRGAPAERTTLRAAG